MKTVYFLILLLISSMALYSQKIIENPKFGISNAPNLKITRIEITKKETILSFHVSQLIGPGIGIRLKSYIQVSGQSDTLFMTKQDTPPKDATGWIPVPEGGLNYRLHFPPIHPKVNKIDFGEPGSRDWKIYDIVINEKQSSSLIPEKLIGNWFSTETNYLWTCSFFDTVAIYKNKIWKYVSMVPEKDYYKISLKCGDENMTLLGKTDKDGTCWLGENPGSMEKYSNAMQHNQKINPEDQSGWDEKNILEKGTVVYKGLIKGFTGRLGTKNGIIRYSNPLTNNVETYLIKIADDGSFRVEFPLDFPQELVVSLPSGSQKVFFEPSKELFHLINSGDLQHSSLFSGENAALNFGLTATSNIRTSEIRLVEGVYDMDPATYINHIKRISEKEREALSQIGEKESICRKAIQIRELEILLREAYYSIQYNQSRRISLIYSNQNLKENERRQFNPVSFDPSGLEFLKGLPLNNNTCLLTNEYFNVLNALKYTDFERPQGSSYFVLGLVRDYLEKNGTKLTGEESDMLDFIKTDLEKNYSEEASRNLSKSYGKTLTEFRQKYLDIYSKVSNEVLTRNFRTNLGNIFGIQEGLACDIPETQIFLSRLKNFSVSEEEFTRYKKSVQNMFLKEKIISAWYEKKAEQILINSPAEYIPKNEADKFFDGLIKKFRGKLVYVDFWATWCGPCKAGIERIKPLKEELAKEDIVFVYITNPSSPENDYQKMKPDIKGEHFKVSDDEWNLLVSKFGIYGIPHYALVARNGKIINPNLMLYENEPLKKLLMEQLKK